MSFYAEETSAEAARLALKEELQLSDENTPDARSIRRWYNKKRLKEHFEHLADIAQSILEGLDKVSKNTPRGNEFDIHKYSIMQDDAGWGATHKQLSDRVWMRIEEAEDQYGLEDIGYLIVHLEAASDDIKAKGFRKFARENPFELLESLKEPARTKKFKGKCSKCQHWGP